MQKILKILFALALLLGLASTIAVGAHRVNHPDVMRGGHSERAYPLDTSHWLI